MGKYISGHRHIGDFFGKANQLPEGSPVNFSCDQAVQRAAPGVVGEALNTGTCDILAGDSPETAFLPECLVFVDVPVKFLARQYFVKTSGLGVEQDIRHGQFAAGFQHAVCLAEELSAAFEVRSGFNRDDGVEGLIWKLKTFGRHQVKVASRNPAAAGLKLVGGDIDAVYLVGRIMACEISGRGSHTAANIEYPALAAVNESQQALHEVFAGCVKILCVGQEEAEVGKSALFSLVLEVGLDAKHMIV